MTLATIDAAAIEKLSQVDTMVIDKTGTLTEGRPRVVHIEPAPGFLPDDLLVKLASVERASEHPLAMAVVAAAQERHLPLVEVTDFDSPVGKGVLGKVGNVALVSGAAKFLAEHGVVVEKTGLYSFFIMFTIGITKGRWNTLLTALQQFKDDYAKNQPMWKILPEFCQKHPRYERMGLRDLCQHVHEMYARYDIARLTTEMYLSDLAPAMKPSDAYAHIAQRKTERVEIDHLEGRITVGLVTPYPPGIPLLIPGEVFNKKIVDYLKFARQFNQECPGFETDIHGLVEIKDEDGKKRYYADCVKES